MKVKLQRWEHDPRGLFSDNPEGKWVLHSDLAPLLRLAVAMREFEDMAVRWERGKGPYVMELRHAVDDALAAVEFEEGEP